MKKCAETPKARKFRVLKIQSRNLEVPKLLRSRNLEILKFRSSQVLKFRSFKVPKLLKATPFDKNRTRKGVASGFRLQIGVASSTDNIINKGLHIPRAVRTYINTHIIGCAYMDTHMYTKVHIQTYSYAYMQVLYINTNIHRTHANNTLNVYTFACSYSHTCVYV